MGLYIKKSVKKPVGISAGSAAAKEPNVTVIDVDDILLFPPCDENGVRMLGSFGLKPGAKMYQFYSTQSKISAPYESDGDEDSINIAQSFDAQHPGNELEIKEFIQNWLGKNVVIIHGSCQDPWREVMGTPCAPLQLSPSKQDNNDGRFHMLKFKSFAKTALLPKHYEGALLFDAPFNVVLTTAVGVNTANGSFYKLPSLATTALIGFSEISLAHGKLIQLIGGGGADPATLVTGVADKKAILKNGATWTGLENAFINLRVFTAGAMTFLIEESRG